MSGFQHETLSIRSFEPQYTFILQVKWLYPIRLRRGCSFQLVVVIKIVITEPTISAYIVCCQHTITWRCWGVGQKAVWCPWRPCRQVIRGSITSSDTSTARSLTRWTPVSEWISNPTIINFSGNLVTYGISYISISATCWRTTSGNITCRITNNTFILDRRANYACITKIIV
jgi:hypothetical protein